MSDPSPHALCAVSPSPQLRERLRVAAEQARRTAGLPVTGPASLLKEPRRLGFNDGVLRPPSAERAGADRRTVAAGGPGRAPLRGTVRVLVVLVDFSDKSFDVDTSRFEELFFSTGTIPTGSVAEYYKDVTGGLVEITGQVVGPLRMKETLAWYANGNYGIGNPSGDPRAQFMAECAAREADAVVDMTPYDNDGDGYVDAFVVVHAGRGGEETGDSGDLWSHKWTLPQEYAADGTKVFAYLTIPEDAKLGVSAHELGHLLFGFPDLYDTDYSSAGIGNWCLMAGGSWNGGGDTPAHPSAWCKAQQGWVQVENVTADGSLTLPDVKDSRTVHRLWTGGGDSKEYFLVENRQQAGFDADLPGSGLLVWHVDEGQEDNTHEDHYLVGLLQADGLKELESDANRGDGADCYPGWYDNRTVTGATTPATTTYAGTDSGVVVARISDSSPSMTAVVSVSGTVPPSDPGDPGDPGDLAALRRSVEELSARVDALAQAVASAGSTLGSVSVSGSAAASGSVPQPRPPARGAAARR
jgi:immune inhibitor A